MPDELDRASENEEAYRADAIKKVLEPRPKLPLETFDGLHCVDCKIEIPAKRLELKCIRCFECQLVHEIGLKYLRP